MDGFPICFYSEILLELLEELDVDKHDAVTEDVEKEMTGLENSGRNKSANEDSFPKSNLDTLVETERGSIDDQVEEVFTEDPFDSGDTEEIVCTEILENSEEEDDKTVEADNLKARSWYDLFNEAYGSWGRDENKSLEAPLIESSLEITESSEEIPVKRRIDDGDMEKTEQDVSVNPDNNTEIDSNEEGFQDPDKDLTFETFYKLFFDNLDLNINGTEEHQVDENEGTSGVQTVEYEDIFNDPSANCSESGNTDCDGKPTRTPTKRAKTECRRSARLSSNVLSDLGSVVKIEKEDGIKIVLRRSSRLAERRKGPEEEDGAWKKPKK